MDGPWTQGTSVQAPSGSSAWKHPCFGKGVLVIIFRHRSWLEGAGETSGSATFTGAAAPAETPSGAPEEVWFEPASHPRTATSTPSMGALDIGQSFSEVQALLRTTATAGRWLTCAELQVSCRDRYFDSSSDVMAPTDP